MPKHTNGNAIWYEIWELAVKKSNEEDNYVFAACQCFRCRSLRWNL